MWIHNTTQKVFNTHTDIRLGWPNVSFPKVMNDEGLAAFGLYRVVPARLPEFDCAISTVEEAGPLLIDGVWTQQWTVRDLTPEELKARVPTVVTMRQARLALLQAGLLSQVEAAIAAIEDPVQRQAVQIEWEYAADINRARPWVQGLADALGLNETQLDDLFVAASRL